LVHGGAIVKFSGVVIQFRELMKGKKAEKDADEAVDGNRELKKVFSLIIHY